MLNRLLNRLHKQPTEGREECQAGFAAEGGILTQDWKEEAADVSLHQGRRGKPSCMTQSPQPPVARAPW